MIIDVFLCVHLYIDVYPYVYVQSYWDVIGVIWELWE